MDPDDKEALHRETVRQPEPEAMGTCPRGHRAVMEPEGLYVRCSVCKLLLTPSSPADTLGA